MSVFSPYSVAARTTAAIVMLSVALATLGCKDGYSRLKETRRVGFISEERTWALAVKTPLPSYPAPSLRAQVHGPAVATVLIEGNGFVLGSKVLQAPDSASGEAFKQALSQWEFQPLELPDGKLDEGTITLYFEIRQGAGIVLTALDKIRETNPTLPSGKAAK